MFSWFRTVGTAIAIMALAVGCTSQEDRNVQEQIATLDKLTAIYGNIVDMDSLKANDAEIGTLRTRITQLEKELTNLGAERRDAALKKYSTQLGDARERLKTARAQTAEKAFGLKMSK